MPDPLETQLDLDISEALARIQGDLRTSIEETMAQAGVSLADAILSVLPIKLEADASAIPPEIEAAVTAAPPVPIEADTSAIPDEIDAAITATPVAPIVVEADTSPAVAALDNLDSAAVETGTALHGISDSGATEALDSIASAADGASAALGEVGNSASSSSGEMDGFESATKGVEGVSALAEGGLGGLAGGLEATGLKAGGAVPFVAAAVAAVGGLAEEGLKAVSAEERFNAILGESAKAVEDVRVGTLKDDIFHLGIEFGSTRAQMQNAVATVYQHADAAGFAAGKARTYADELVAMAARAVALNPALGSISDVVDSLETKFARSRGLVQYGLAISQADINTRALDLSGKEAANQLTVQDKAYAGLAIATEKYGSNLNEIVAKGAENAANKQKALKAELGDFLEEAGKPLVAPFLDTLRDALPVGKAAGEVLGTLGSTVLPLLADVLGVVGPVASDVASGFQIMSDALDSIPPEVIYAIAGGLALMAIDAFLASGGIIALTIAMQDNPVTVFATGIVALAGALGLFGGSSQEAKTDLQALGKESDATFTKMAEALAAIQAAGRQGGGIANALAGEATKRALADLRDLAGEDTAAAQRLGQALENAGTITDAQFNSAIQHGIKLQRDHADAAQQNVDAVHKLTDAEQAVVFTTDAAAVASKNADSVHKSAVATYVALGGSVTSYNAELGKEAQQYAINSAAVSDYKTRLDVLNSTTLSVLGSTQQEEASFISATQALKDNANSLDLHTDAGNKDVAALVSLTQSVQAHAAAVLQQTGDQDAANAVMADGANRVAELLIQTNAAPASIKTMLDQLGLTASITDPGTRAILGLTAAVGDALPAAADTGTHDYDDSLADPSTGLAAATDKAAKAALDKVAPGTWDLPSKMADIGFAAGSNLDTAMGYGISSNSHVPEAASSALIGAIKRIFQQASPSKVFMDIGEQNAAGLISGMADNIHAGIPTVVDAASALTDATASALGVKPSTAVDPTIAMKKALADMQAASLKDLSDAAASIAYDQAHPENMNLPGLNLDFLRAIQARDQAAAQVKIEQVTVHVTAPDAASVIDQIPGAVAAGVGQAVTEHQAVQAGRIA